jgi:hypothetical protein
MRKFLKISATFVYLLIWGQLASGCLEGAKSTGGGAGYAMANIFNLILLFGGIYGIWKFNPTDDSNKGDDITLNKD